MFVLWLDPGDAPPHQDPLPLHKLRPDCRTPRPWHDGCPGTRTCTVQRIGGGGGIAGHTFSDLCLRARLLFCRLTKSTLVAGASHQLHKSRFAHPHELAPLMLGERPKPGTHLLIGRGPYNQLLAVQPQPTHRELGNIVIIAPPRHGKGLHATAELLTWEHSVIVIDVKGEHYERTAGARAAQFGPTFVLSPEGFGNSFDPLRHCRTEDEFMAMADYLLEKTGDKAADAFIQRGRNMLTAIFMAGHKEGYPLLPYLAHLIRIGPEATAKRLQRLSQQLGLPEDQNLATRFLDRQFSDADFGDRYLQNSWSNLKAILLPILTETVIRCLSGSDFTIEQSGQAARSQGRVPRRRAALPASD